MQDAISSIAFLTGSNTRVAVFDAIRRAGRLDRNDLRNRIEASRTTVGRHLDALEERDWIQRTNDGYELTTIGELVAADFFTLVETAATARRLRPFFRWVPNHEFDLDLRHLADANVTIGDPEDPYAIEDRHVRRTETASRLRLLLPLVGQRAVRASLSRVMERDQTVELILKPDVAELFDSHSQYASMYETLRRRNRYTVFVYEDEISYCLGILDETVQLLSFDNDGMPRVMLETDEPAVREWAEGVYDEYRRESTPFAEFNRS